MEVRSGLGLKTFTIYDIVHGGYSINTICRER